MYKEADAEMSFNREKGLFNVAPGFHFPKRERIIKALQKLHEKIQRLEQVRRSEKQAISAEVQTGVDDGDLTLTDIQYLLLLLQLKYVRGILKKKTVDQQNSASSEEVTRSKSLSNNNIPLSTGINLGNTSDRYGKNNQDKETQIGSSFAKVYLQEEERDNSKQCPIKENGNIVKVAAAVQTFDETDNTADFKSESSKPVPTNFKSTHPHYFLKLSDVPFIIGASTSDSHSVIANLQNIIAKLKSHNKATCGHKLPIQRNSVPATNKKQKQESVDTSKMLKNLYKELSELSQKQEGLKEKIDHIEKRDRFGSKMELSCSLKKGIHNQGNCSQKPSKMSSKVQEEKIIIPNVRTQCNVTSQGRRKFLHSLQDFKAHLSDEDISWN
ncbi:centrosomal protein of 57 kDa-like isoform X2 [Stegodyphus dumicola]|uniref:centrosomal protein of 57 kDa-like isoform X2 n=1 Tax=Stegodyphus dumicola TaxID=202533 RepID=UPI0015AC6506|nr:centrosomal protein of 57 kDa-like isoform X2 [Stegodyphus dumicola]